LTCGAVVRRNWLENNAQIKISGVCRDIVVEANRVENAEWGIYVGPQTTNVLVHGNEFVNVQREVEDKSVLSAH
jgi:nitrous oxidase accessory protein NosD